ncbi:unnamed protein product [Coffea canephora]|uniref:Uncharacterized protein n=1 Tax=Coffea canephora TaxID=49390 RepID=A0A068UE35_COFCA|nr:unnamed protein product [Coffea canephora]
MNFLKRAITSQLSHSSHPSRKSLFLLRPVTQSSYYSTTYKLNNPQTNKPRTQKPPQEPSGSSSSLTWSQRVKKQSDELTAWPRPSEIPFQAKVANLVNLIGHITTPIKFQSTPDGKYLSGAVFSQENESFDIPVVFEGDLAHVVASHVKKNDCVYVVGRLSEDPLPFVLSESQGKFHLLVENINFVQGFEKKAFDFKSKKSSASDAARNALSKTTIAEGENDASEKYSGKTVETGNFEPKISQTSLRNADTRRDGDSVWRDLVNNPTHWRDYREQKLKGLVKEKYPDFKNKDDGTALWLNKAPEFVWSGLQRLDFDGYAPKQKNMNVAKDEESWKSLVENPSKWWDNRVGKKNAKSPDFKHKETGDALWLNRSPDWVLSKLPPLKEPQNAPAGKKNMQAT